MSAQLDELGQQLHRLELVARERAITANVIAKTVAEGEFQPSAEIVSRWRELDTEYSALVDALPPPGA